MIINTTINKSFSLFLITRPSFTEGMSRIVDFGGTLNIYNESETPEEADSLAIYSDWKAIGDDLRSAINEYERSAGAR